MELVRAKHLNRASGGELDLCSGSEKADMIIVGYETGKRLTFVYILCVSIGGMDWLCCLTIRLRGDDDLDDSGINSVMSIDCFLF